MELASLIVTSIGTAIGLGGLVYALMAKRAKASLEKLIKSELRGLAENISYIRSNPGWADSHFRSIRDECLKMDLDAHTQIIIKHAMDGARDSTAAERMLINLEKEVLFLQEGLFGTREEVYSNAKKPK